MFNQSTMEIITLTPTTNQFPEKNLAIKATFREIYAIVDAIDDSLKSQLIKTE